jgi:hypothetical protein
MLLKVTLLLSYLAACTNAAVAGMKEGGTLWPNDRNPIQLNRHYGTTIPSTRAIHQVMASTSNIILTDVVQAVAVNVSFGTERRSLIIDTGSSDTWMPIQGFECLNLTTARPQPQAACAFPLPISTPKQFVQIPNAHINGSYGSGEYILGKTGLSPVTIGDSLHIPQQQVNLVTTVAYDGNNITSGFLGLAYSAFTSVFVGTSPSLDNNTVNHSIYSPVIETLVNEGLLQENIFSMAISRDKSNTGTAGLLEFGRVPDLTDPRVNASANFVRTPIRPFDNVIGFSEAFFAYTIAVDGVNTTTGPLPNSSALYEVDTGTTLNTLPTKVATTLLRGFEPPVFRLPGVPGYVANCTATGPQHGFTIAGETFWINPADLLLPYPALLPEGTCFVGVQDGGGTGPFLLGDTFLRNVVAVFDVGNQEMRFSSRMYYKS